VIGAVGGVGVLVIALLVMALLVEALLCGEACYRRAPSQVKVRVEVAIADECMRWMLLSAD